MSNEFDEKEVGESNDLKEEGLVENEDEEEDADGEDILPQGYSDDEEEDEDELPTEADLKFIADSSDEDIVQSGINRKKKRKKHVERDDEEILSEDELELIQENIGTRKKLRNKKEVEQIFDESDDGIDDLDEFVVNDMEDADEETKINLKKRRKERLEFEKSLGSEFGISDSAWRDIEELFLTDDYTYALYLKPGESFELPEDMAENEDVELTVKKREITLMDVYEPSEIKEKMLTDLDEAIRVRDIPERFQIQKFVEPSDNEISREAQIICKTIIKPDQSETALLSSITSVLRFYRQENFEIPFIYRHRRDYFNALLDLPELWRIADLDEKFRAVEQRKKQLAQLILEIASIDSTIESDEQVKGLVEKIVTQDDVNDTQAFIQLMYSKQVSAIPSRRRGRHRPAPWKVKYDDALANGISVFCEQFDINIQNYVTSVTSQQTMHFPEDYKDPPELAASIYLCRAFPSPELVLEAARHKIAQEIAVHPQLRAFIRRVFYNDSVICVSPTEKGNVEIEQNHPYYPFKYLLDKPRREFTDGQFLQLLRAESDGLLIIDIRVEEEAKLLQDLCKDICNDYVNELAGKWNEERRKIAIYAAKEIMFPQAVKWLKERLGSEAMDRISIKCQAVMESKINMQGFKNTDGYHPTVLSMSCGDGGRGSATIAVIVSDNGELVETKVLEKLIDRENASAVNDLVDLIKRQRPNIVCFCGFKPTTKTILEKLLRDRVWPEGQAHWDIVPELMLIEDDYARIFMNSRRGKIEFPEKDFPMLVRYCVSMARYVQNPIMEYAGLFNHDEDIKAVRLDNLQKLLPEEMLLKAIERAFMDVVNQHGVDINLAVAFPHYAHTLKFVSGLGPRKAQSMISKILRTGGKLESRQDLIKNNICQWTIFMNCASFIRVKEIHFLSNYRDQQLDVLDDTRVHPEDYELARKMAADALDLEDAVLEEDENPSLHVKELMENEVEKLNYLMLDDYALELEKQLRAPKKVCLYDIKDELIAPYSDMRKKFSCPGPEDVFMILTGESRDTLYEGAIVSAVIVRVRERMLIVQLGSGLEGQIHVNNMDIPYGSENDITNLFQNNQALITCVLSLNFERLTVELSSRQQDVDQYSSRMKLDRFFDTDLQRRDAAAKKTKKKQVVNKPAARTVRHPYWKPVNFRKAEEYLEKRPRSEVVVRPSGKGNDHISITWKVDEGIYQHVDVKESEKPNEWTLGRRLTIENRVFTEIDQILVEYINPMTTYISNLIEHPKYQKKSLIMMQDYLEEQYKSLHRSVYGFIISTDKPGSFLLVIRHPQNRPRSESIKVTPEGYEFRNKRFTDVDRLLDFFKKDEMARLQASKQREYPTQRSRDPNGMSKNGQGGHRR